MQIDYSDYGNGGSTRVIGIYEDPLIAIGKVIKNSDLDSQRRFQNDLYIDNLEIKVGIEKFKSIKFLVINFLLSFNPIFPIATKEYS